MLNIVLLKYEPYAILPLLFSFNKSIFFFLTRRVFNTSSTLTSINRYIYLAIN